MEKFDVLFIERNNQNIIEREYIPNVEFENTVKFIDLIKTYDKEVFIRPLQDFEYFLNINELFSLAIYHIDTDLNNSTQTGNIYHFNFNINEIIPVNLDFIIEIKNKIFEVNGIESERYNDYHVFFNIK